MDQEFVFKSYNMVNQIDFKSIIFWKIEHLEIIWVGLLEQMRGKEGSLWESPGEEI